MKTHLKCILFDDVIHNIIIQNINLGQ